MAGGMSFAPHVIFFQLTQFRAIQTTIGFGLLLFIACSSFVGNHDDIFIQGNAWATRSTLMASLDEEGVEER